MISSDNEDALNERANDLEAENFNGLERAHVHPVAVPSYAELEVSFHNTLHRDTLVAAGNTPARAAALFPLRGGLRVRAGAATGQIRSFAVDSGPTADSVILRVEFLSVVLPHTPSRSIRAALI